MVFLSISCAHREHTGKDPDSGSPSEVVRKRRDDGTISSINQVDASGKVHGVRVTFYEDGKTIYSKHSFVHGRKHGPAIWYYKNGQRFKHTHFENGKRSRVYLITENDRQQCSSM